MIEVPHGFSPNILDPCLYCGGKSEWVGSSGNWGNAWAIQCSQCGIGTKPVDYSVEDICRLIALWNKETNR